MVKIFEIDDYAKWSGEATDSQHGAVNLRAALRVLPQIGRATGERDDALYSVVLQTVFAAYVGWYSAISGDLQSTELQNASRLSNDFSSFRNDDPFGRWGNTQRSIEMAIQDLHDPFPTTTNMGMHFAIGAAHGETRPGNLRQYAATREVEADIDLIESGTSGASLLKLPLWKEDPIPELQDSWIDLRTQLLRNHSGFRFFQIWYDSLLSGETLQHDVLRKVAKTPVDLLRASPSEFLDHIEAEIACLIDKLANGKEAADQAEEAQTLEPESKEPANGDAFEPPEPRSAPVRMTVEDGVLKIRKPDGEQIDDIARNGWTALCEEIDELALQVEGKSGNNELLPYLRRGRRALGDSFNDLNVVRFGLAALTIEQFAREADNLGMLMPEQAAPLRSIVLQKNLMLRHSPEWSAYISEIEAPIADAETEQEAANLAAEISREIVDEHADVVPPETSEILEELAAATEVQPSPDNPDAIAPPEARRSWLRAFTEEMRAIALDIIAEYRKLMVKGVAVTFATGSLAIVTSVSTKLLGLADKLPQEYAWLKDLVFYAASLVGA